MKKIILALILTASFTLTACDRKVVNFLGCVIKHESANTPNPVVAQNPRSSASGLFQFVDGTWRTLSSRYGVPGYSKARHAPAKVQIYVAYKTVQDGGRSHWKGTGC